jgi:hypothetical protein
MIKPCRRHLCAVIRTHSAPCALSSLFFRGVHLVWQRGVCNETGCVILKEKISLGEKSYLWLQMGWIHVGVYKMRVVRFKLVEMWHRVSLVSISTRLWDGHSTDQTSIQSKIMYSSQQRPDRYWERQTSYRVSTGILFERWKRPWREAEQSCPAPRL